MSIAPTLTLYLMPRCTNDLFIVTARSATGSTRTHVGNEANAIKADAVLAELKPGLAALPGYVKVNRTVCKSEWACARARLTPLRSTHQTPQFRPA